MTAEPGPAPRDLLRAAASGLLARRTRAVLSALGVAIGIATLVTVVAIPASAKTDLLDQLAREGNLLSVQSGQTFDGVPTPLPRRAVGMIRRIPPVRRAAPVGIVIGASVRRSAAIPAVSTGGIAVAAADTSLLATVDARVLHGTFLNAATARYPAVVLGSDAAAVLGIPDVSEPVEVDIAGHAFAVVGVLAPTPLTPALDQTVFVGFPVARSLLGFDGRPTQIYLRADPDQVADVERVLAATTNPETPEAVLVSHPSDILAARATARGALNGLLLALGAVALLVAGIGIANVMVISVLERRGEIGLRRALGATRRDITFQFLAESLALAAMGGVLGVLAGVWATSLYASLDHLSATVPVVDALATLGAALLVGAVAGWGPASRAARLDPTEALRAT